MRLLRRIATVLPLLCLSQLALAAPQVSLSANSQSVSVGQTVRLSWNSSDAWSCRASGDWSGSLSADGAKTSPTLSQTKRYQFWIICEGASGQRAEDVVYVQAGSSSSGGESASSGSSSGSSALSASPASVSTGGRTTISWNLPGARNCRASGDWSGSRSSSGSVQTSALTSNKRYQYWMLCTASDGSRIEKVAYVQVGSGAPASSGSSSSSSGSGDLNLTSSSSSVSRGGRVTLRWSAPSGSSCRASGDWSGSKSSSGSTTTAALNESKRYQYWLICDGSRGRQEDVVYVSTTGSSSGSSSGSGESSAPPSGSSGSSGSSALSASPASVSTGGRTTISWNLPGARNCRASGDWSGSRSSSGSLQTSALTSSRRHQYWMLCTASDGSRIEKVAYVQVGSSGSGSSSGGSTSSGSGDFQFSANSSSVSTGGTVTLSWNAPGATSCNASGDWSGSKSRSGSTASPVMSQSRQYQYWMVCNGSNGRQEAVVKVTASGSGGGESSGGGSSSPDSPRVNFSASDTRVQDGDSVTLNWSSTGATSCWGSGAWSGGLSTSGSRQVTADLSNRSYSLTCSNSQGSSLAIVSLDVRKVVNVAWAAPTKDEDGSPVSALAGYNVKYGRRSGDYSTTKFVNGRSNTRTSIELTSGTYYFVVTALSESGLESRNSGEAVANLR